MATALILASMASAGSAAATIGTAATVSAGLAAAAPAMMAATSLFTAASSIRQGEAQEVILNQQAKAAEVEAKDREIERRKGTLSVLAAQNVAVSAAGITGGGSARVLQEKAISTGAADVQAIRAGGQTQAATLRSRGKFARRGGRISAVGSLLQGGLQASQL